MKTLLMNSTRHEYIELGLEFPEKVGYYMQRLEKFCHWDLRLDTIYVSYGSTYGYRDVRDSLIVKCQD
jgi:hypothetical protein